MANEERDEGYVARTFRLKRELADALKLEATLREINRVEPTSQQEIVAEALRLWFDQEALTRPSRSDEAA